MLACTNTRSEDAALDVQGFKPLCLSTAILGSRAVQLGHHGERFARLSDYAAHPAGHIRAKTKDFSTIGLPSSNPCRNICRALSGPRKEELSSPRDTGQSAPELKLSCLTKGLHTGNRCRCC